MNNFKFLDYEGLKHLIEQIKAGYVQKESGKGLSEHDFNQTYKVKLDSIKTGAEVNTVYTVNDQVGNVILSANDIKYKPSKSGSMEKSISVALDNLMSKDEDHEAALETKANQITTYTIEEVDALIAAYDSGVLTVNGKQGVVVLNTDDLSDDGRTNKFVTTQEKSDWNAKADRDYLDQELDGKVDKIIGKGLSTKDFTEELKGRLENVEPGAQVNDIALIQKNGTNLPIQDGKVVNIIVPTTVGDLTNDLQYQTRSEVEALISEQGKMKKVVVEELPELEEADHNTMYLVPNGSTTNPGFIEYMIIEGIWEILGDTAAVDFTGYVKEQSLIPITFEEINLAFAI